MKISIALLISLVSLQLFAQQQTWHRKQYNARGYTRIDAKFHGQKGTYYNRFGQAKQVFIPWHPSMGTRNVVRQEMLLDKPQKLFTAEQAYTRDRNFESQVFWKKGHRKLRQGCIRSNIQRFLSTKKVSAEDLRKIR